MVERKESYRQATKEDLRELVFSLVSKLQHDIYTANRISLYNQDGIGLNFALEHGVENQSEYAFYYNLFVPKENAEDSSSSDRGS
jgi:hypothetical protein